MEATSSKAALLPCPFCGGSAVVVAENSQSNDEWVHCPPCDASILNPFSGPARAAWNRRPAQDDLLAAAEVSNAALRAERDEAKEIMRECLNRPIGQIVDARLAAEARVVELEAENGRLRKG